MLSKFIGLSSAIFHLQALSSIIARIYFEVGSGKVSFKLSINGENHLLIPRSVYIYEKKQHSVSIC